MPIPFENDDKIQFIFFYILICYNALITVGIFIFSIRYNFWVDKYVRERNISNN